MIPVKDRFDEIFKVEIEGWCYGVQCYPGEIFPGLVHRVIKEISPLFKEAIEHYVVIDILTISEKFSKAAKYLVHEKEIAFSILSQFPLPKGLDEDAQFIMGQIIDKVETKYGGALDRLHRKWGWETKGHPSSKQI